MKILLYRGNKLFSHGIEWFTRGDYSHAALLLPDGSVIESVEGVGVRHIPAPTTDAPFDIYEVETTPEQDRLIIDFAMAQVGKPYDYHAIKGFITREKEADDEHAWFCSELVFASFKKGGVELLRRIKAWAVYPSHISYSPLTNGPITQ